MEINKIHIIPLVCQFQEIFTVLGSSKPYSNILMLETSTSFFLL